MIPITVALLAALFLQQGAAHPIDLCLVDVADAKEAQQLFRLVRDYDDHAPIVDGKARIYSDKDEEARLVRAGWKLEIVQHDLARFYAERALRSPPPPVMGGSMGGFKTLAEIVAEMDRLAQTYPSIVSPKFSIGTTVGGRPIWCLRISDNPALDEPGEAIVWYDALHHAREPMGGEALLLFADWLCTNYPANPDAKRLVETRNMLFTPCVNPDGYEYNRSTNPGGGGLWRKNRRNNGDGTFGVDLNRNYGYNWGPQWNGSSSVTSAETYRGTYAFSELETQALRNFLLLHPPGFSFSAHTYSDLWLFPWGYATGAFTPDDAKFRHYAQAFAANNGWVYGTPPEVLYEANGVSADWGYGQQGTYAFSPEISNSADGFWPAPARIPALFAAVQPAMLESAKWSGAWVEPGLITWKEISGDGDAYRAAGEVWELEFALVNQGVLPANGVLSLSSSTNAISVVQPDDTFGVAAQKFSSQHLPGSHANAQLEHAPIRIAIAPNAPDGVQNLSLAITWDGLTTAYPVSIVLGAPRLLASDDMEVSNFGWTVTTTGANYAFERAVPQQTTSGGQIVQPGNDDPAGTGTMCWVTGAAAGANAGTNDVDGITTLTSPRFRASGFGHLELSYARWFANLPGGPLDDHMLVEVSNNDGANWVQVENTSNHNVWTTKTFTLESLVALSDTMRLRFTVADSPSNDLTEGLVDDLFLRTTSSLPALGEWGAATSGASVRLFVDGLANKAFHVRSSSTSSAGTTTSGVAGLNYLGGTPTDVANGTADANGQAIITWVVPSATGTTRYLQAICDENGAQAAYSQLLTIVVQ